MWMTKSSYTLMGGHSVCVLLACEAVGCINRLLCEARPEHHRIGYCELRGNLENPPRF